MKATLAALLCGLALGTPALAASIALDSSNWLGPAGARFWTIKTPGSYYLGIPESAFVTANEYAIRIEVGGVVLDGMGKTLTGSVPPTATAVGTPNLYGVRVNGGKDISNVRVTNLKVTNKYFGVIFEAVDGGQMDGITATGNQVGLYFWRTSHSTVQQNVASNNLQSGIVCDADTVVNTQNTLSNNVADHNGQSGIFLWDACVNSSVLSNLARDNVQMGIALTAPATGNTVTWNVVAGNSTGIWVSSNANSIAANIADGNTNVGIVLQGAAANTLDSNTLVGNLNSGIWLDASSRNTIRGNTIANPGWGIFHANGSAGQIIYNNYLSNVEGNAGFSASGSNAWSVASAPGINVVGGPSIGGNYWAAPGGTGFSETATDADHNGFADGSYVPIAGNVDALPLVAKARALPAASFDGNNSADLLWRKASTGENALWLMNGGAADGQYIAPVADAGWSIVGRASFDGDGQADILWRHTDGRNAIWFMDGTKVKPSTGYLPTVTDRNWNVAGVGDFDGDGFADILWRNAVTGENVIWYVRGLTVRVAAALATVSDFSWQVAGIADFDGDGRSDILWRNVTTGQNVLWTFDSYTSFLGTPVASAAPSWSIAGVGDFDGDGNADILWRDGTGQNAIWFQDGSSTLSSAYLPAAATDWSVGFVGDVDRDGKSDIVWRRTDGSVVVWQMRGATVTAGTYVGNAAGWTLIR